MFEIRELTGQDYVDVYATKKAETLPTDVAQRRRRRRAAADREPTSRRHDAG